MKLPEIGTTMYSVHEHCYYVPDRAAPLVEYCICEGKMTGYYQGGYKEIIVTGKSPDGYDTPWFYRPGEVGKKVFYTEKEAEDLADRMADEYDKRWSGLGRGIFKPMRRPWKGA